MNIIKNLINLFFSKAYGVGDNLPKGLKISNLNCHDVYKSRQIIKILNNCENSPIKKLDVKK